MTCRSLQGRPIPVACLPVTAFPISQSLICYYCHDPQDFAREADPQAGLRSLSLKTFAKLMFQKCPSLSQYSDFLDEIYRQFNEYKQVHLQGASHHLNHAFILTQNPDSLTQQLDTVHSLAASARGVLELKRIMTREYR